MCNINVKSKHAIVRRIAVGVIMIIIIIMVIIIVIGIVIVIQRGGFGEGGVAVCMFFQLWNRAT